MLVGMWFFIGILIYAFKQSAIRYRFDRWLWQLAQHNTFLTSLYYTNILHIWSLLLDSGISIINTIDITKHIWRNSYGESCSNQVYDMLCKGHSFCESLKSSSVGTHLYGKWSLLEKKVVIGSHVESL